MSRGEATEREKIREYQVSDIARYLDINEAKYVNRFRNLEEGHRQINFYAFFFGEIWYAYRMMWKEGLLILLADIIITIIIGVLAIILALYSPSGSIFLVFLIMLLAEIVKMYLKGRYADQIYWKKIRSRLDLKEEMTAIPVQGVSYKSILGMGIIRSVCIQAAATISTKIVMSFYFLGI